MEDDIYVNLLNFFILLKCIPSFSSPMELMPVILRAADSKVYGAGYLRTGKTILPLMPRIVILDIARFQKTTRLSNDAISTREGFAVRENKESYKTGLFITRMKVSI